MKRHFAQRYTRTVFFALLAMCALQNVTSVTAQGTSDIFTADSTEKAFFEIHFATGGFESQSGAANAQNTGETRVIVLFQLRRDAVAFEKTDSPTRGKSAFVGFPVVQIAFADSDGIIRASREWRDTVYLESARKTSSDYIYGSATFFLAPGRYSFALDAGDKSLPRSLRLREKNVVVSDLIRSSAPIAFGTPLFGAARAGLADTLFPLCMNNAIAFGSDGKVFMSASVPEEGSFAYSYSIRRLLWQEETVVAAETIRTGDVILRSGLTFAADEKRRMAVVRPEPNNPRSALLELSIPGSSLEEGNYRLFLTRQGARDTLAYDFGVEWANKPRSLKNVYYAIDILRYVVTDEEYNALRKGTLREVQAKFDEFWKRRDPTPNTAYNEALYAYYSRVDEAFYRFSAPQLGVLDGAKTDRGKVFILCGAPTSIDKLPGSGKTVTEVWRYENKVRKEFTFEIPKNGEYALKNVRDL